ncbi:MAG: single-stranded DNA-binding protein [Spirochaetes bacterium]|nr:single-stranded DNA-binding protein [Spirochaetota bacterium]
MASDINRVVLIGRLVKDPDLKYTQSGTSIASFSIANNRTYVSGGEKKEQVSYFNCIAWGKPGEIIAQYMKKGQRIGLDGHLQQRSWDDKDGNKRYTVEVVVENFQFLTSPAGAGNGESSGGSYTDSFSGMNVPDDVPDSGGNPFSDDDIPF